VKKWIKEEKSKKWGKGSLLKSGDKSAKKWRQVC